MADYYIRKLCSDKQIENINNLIAIANQDNSWSDGLISGGGTKQIKNNLELTDVVLLSEVNSIVMESLDNDLQFLHMTVAKNSYLNIVSKTTSGGYYHPHTDSHDNGDYSTTVFLNDPNEYEGGELCLYLNDKEEKIKLDKGWAVTYKTGILHRVNRVVSGCRYASVLWTKSKIKDDFMRNVCFELRKIQTLLEQKKFDDTCIINFESSLKNPKFLTENLLNDIIRRYG